MAAPTRTSKNAQAAVAAVHAAAMLRAEATATIFGQIEAQFLAPVASALSLSYDQREGLSREWAKFRARAARSG